MANCVYKIYIPGRGVIKIPSDHGIFEMKNSDGSDSIDYSSLNTLLNQLRDIEDKNSIEINKIEASIQNIARRVSGIHNLVLPDFDLDLSNSDIINRINRLINERSSSSFYKSLRTYLYKNVDSYSELTDLLSNKPTINYFKEILTPKFVNTNKILRTSSLNREIEKLSRKITGYDDIHWNNILTFLQSVNIDKESEILMGFSTEMGLKAVNFENYSFFKYGDYDSLFMSLFKRVGSSIDTIALNTVLENNNINSIKNSSDFFENEIVDDIISNSKFEELLLNNKNNKAVSEIISLVVSKLNNKKIENHKLENVIKSVLKDLNPSTYGEYARQQTILEQKFDDSEKRLSDKVYNSIVINFGEANGSFRSDTADDNYALAEEVGSTDYLTVKSKINEGQDMVQFPTSEDKTPYVLITKIYPRINGVHIYGIYKSDIKEDYITVNKEFLNDDKIIYRKFEKAINPKSNANVVKSVNTVNVGLTKDMNKQDVVKTFIRKGDTIQTSKSIKSIETVVGIYPAYVLTDKGNKYRYNTLHSFQSSLLDHLFTEDKKIDLNGYVKLNDISLISKNDIIEDPRSEAKGRKVRVIDVTDKNVYVLTGTDNNRFIQAINKEDIKNAWLFAFDTFTKSELSKIQDDISTASIKRESNFSRFTNSSKAQSGDYFVGTINNVKVKGKVLNNNKVIYINEDLTKDPLLVTTIDNIVNPLFLTNRNIYSQYFMSGIRMNGWDISFLKSISKEEENKYSELRYLIPVSKKNEKLFLIPGNYANIGYWSEKQYNYDRSKLMDVTSKVMDLINNDPSGFKTYGLKPYGKIARKVISNEKEYNVFKLNTNSTTPIYGFSNLDPKIKKSLKVLQPGAYITVIDSNGKPNSNIYRIVETTSDSVVAHYNKINNEGNVITEERIFKASELLAGKNKEGKLPTNAIYSLYLINKNNKIKPAITAVQNELTWEQFKDYQSLNKLTDKMTEFYNPYGINVKVDFKGEEFKNNQRAKLTTGNDGEVSIVLNGLEGDKSDLIHENLHIILTALRISDIDIYGEMINSILNENEKELNIYDKEEVFVKKIVDKVDNGTFEALGTNLKTVVTGLMEAVNTINKDINFNLDDLELNPYELLNKTIKEVFKVNNSYESPYFNMNVIQMEPAFRNWMKNNVTLKCT